MRLRGVAARLHPAARIWSPPPAAYLRGPSFRAASSTAAAATAAPAAAKVESPTTRVVGIVLFSSLVGYVTYLCSWQLKRYEWKISLVQLRKERVTGEVRPLAEFVSAADLADVERAEQLAAVVEEEEFRRVAVRGEFDHAQQMLLGPRSAPPGAKQHGAPGGSPSGWDIVTPLRCEDGTVVLVNRGWVPRDSTIPARDPKTGAPNGHAFGVPAAFGQPCGAQQVHGVLKRGEQKNKSAHLRTLPLTLTLTLSLSLTRRAEEQVRPEDGVLYHCSLCHCSLCRYAENRPEERRYVWLDLATMASEGGSAPLLIVAAAQPGEHRRRSHSTCSHSTCSAPLLIVAPARQGERRPTAESPHLIHMDMILKRDAFPRYVALHYARTHSLQGEQPSSSEWPMTRPLESFLDFYVSPTTHLVRPALHTRPAHAPSPLLHPCEIVCLAHNATRAPDSNPTHTALTPRLARRPRTRPSPTCGRAHPCSRSLDDSRHRYTQALGARCRSPVRL